MIIAILETPPDGQIHPVGIQNSSSVKHVWQVLHATPAVGGVEGVKGPANFSACFGAPFLVWHPYVYAEMLAAKLEQVSASAYLGNTGGLEARTAPAIGAA